MHKDLSDLITRLKFYSEGCEEKCVDLQQLKFEAKESEMRLYNEFRSYFFKNDPKNPREPKIVHGIKQFCSYMGMPYSFFAKNPEHMKNQLVSCWLPTLTPEKSAVLVKLRKTSDPNIDIIRAVLPVEFTNVSNADIINIIGEALGDTFNIEFVAGDDRDELTLCVRFISTENFEVCGENCSTGFSVIVSELGAAPMSVNTFLYRHTSKVALMATYGGESFFEAKYEGLQSATLKDLFSGLSIHLRDSLPFLKGQIETVKATIIAEEDTADLLKLLRSRKGLNDKFHVLLMQEVDSKKPANRWEFVNLMAILAKDLELNARVKVEKAAGELLGLQFERT